MFRILFPFLSEAAGAAAEGADAAASGAAPTSSPLIQTIIMIGLFGVAMYFLLYRPQKKQEKAVNDMRSSLKVGDEISTNGGILGKIIQIKEDFLVIETGNDRTKLKIAKWAVRAVERRAEEEEGDDE